MIMKSGLGWVWSELSHRRRRTTRLKGEDYGHLVKSFFPGVLGPIILFAALVTGQGGGWDIVVMVPLSVASLIMAWLIVTEPVAEGRSTQVR